MESSRSHTRVAETARADEIFQLLRDGRPRTRAGLAKHTGLARSTVAARVDALLERGLVKIVGTASSTGGRPSSQIAFNPDARVALAVDLGATHCRVAVTNLTGAILSSRRSDITIADGPEAVLGFVEDLGVDLLHEAGRTVRDLIGVGVGLPGPVEHSTGRPFMPPIMPGWDGFDVPARLRRSFDVPIAVDNDVNIMAFGERAVAWPDVADFLFVKVATGIGAGIIASGRLQRGAQGVAGDLGHIVLSSEAGSGRTLEDMVSGSAIASRLRERGLDAPDSRAVTALVRSGDPDVQAEVREAGRVLGGVLCNFICLMNPSVIVLGGGLAQGSEDLLAGVRELVYSQSTPLATGRLQISRSTTGEDAAIIGASLLAIESAMNGFAAL